MVKFHSFSDCLSLRLGFTTMNSGSRSLSNHLGILLSKYLHSLSEIDECAIEKKSLKKSKQSLGGRGGKIGDDDDDNGTSEKKMTSIDNRTRFRMNTQKGILPRALRGTFGVCICKPGSSLNRSDSDL